MRVERTEMDFLRESEAFWGVFEGKGKKGRLGLAGFVGFVGFMGLEVGLKSCLSVSSTCPAEHVEQRAADKKKR